MTSILGSYKIKKGFSERKNESERIRGKYPDRIPIICEKSARNGSLLPDLDKLLEENGFKRLHLVMTPNGWGDAIYVKKKFLKDTL